MAERFNSIPDAIREQEDIERYLSTHAVAEVEIAVEAITRPDITTSTSPSVRKQKEQEAGKENLKGVMDVLQSAQKINETIVFKPHYRNSSVKLIAPSETVRSLAKREDVVNIFIPQKFYSQPTYVKPNPI